MKTFEFESQLWLPQKRHKVFPFFADAFNLEEITPPWLQFRVISPSPIQAQEGTEIDYRLKIHGIPIRWRSRITVWDPPHRFVDEQVVGPYRRWVHQHRFTERASGTQCTDHVEYAALGGSLVNRFFVAHDVKRIFAYRSIRLQEIFQNVQTEECGKITGTSGTSGLIGTSQIPWLQTAGHQGIDERPCLLHSLPARMMGKGDLATRSAMYQDDLKLFSTAREDTLRLVAELNQAQAEFAPAPGKWSVSEVLDHLILAEALYRKKISELIVLQKAGQKAEIRSDSAEINTSILFIPPRLLPFLELPLTMFNFFVPSFLRERVTQYRMMPAQTPSVAKPRPGRNIETLRFDLRESLHATTQLFENNPNLDYRRMYFSHPLMGKNDILKMIRILALHERRHQSQIKEILTSSAFPVASKQELATTR